MLTLKKIFRISIVITCLFTLYLGIFYPLILFAIGKLISPQQAAGSLLVFHQQVIGSRLIGQTFNSSRYFHSRPSLAGNGYDPLGSGGSNLSQTSQALFNSIGQRIKTLRAATKNPAFLPVDLVTASGSGLDPDISPEAAYYQAQSVAMARKLSLIEINGLIRAHIRARQWGLLGEPRVNVLELNLALDQLQETR